MPVEILADAIRVNETPIDQRASSDFRFWASSRRWQEDGTLEIFQVNLSTPKPINIIAFELAHFPHRVWTEWWDSKTKSWKPCMEYLSDSTTRNPATHPSLIWITDSMPSTLLPANDLKPGEHPQHYGAGHWLAFEVRCQAVTTSQIRLCLQRVRSDKFPRDSTGVAFQYSLGVRGFLCGYRADVLTDVPRTPRDGNIVTENGTFASSTDILGSSVEFAIRKNRAMDLLNGYVWRSEAQPVNYAVVNFYVDARDSSGAAQVIDRFEIDPLYSGTHLNLYWSDDTPDPSTFEASDDVLAFPASRGQGVALTQNSQGLLFPLPVGFVQLDNSRIQWDTRQPWWLAMIFQPQYEMSDATTYVVMDSSSVSIWVTQGLLYARLGAAVLSLPLSFIFNDQIPILLGYQNGQLIMQAAGQEISTNVTGDLTPPSTIRLGASLSPDNVTPAPGNYRLKGLVIKQSMLPDGELDLYVSDPTGYVTKATYWGDDTGTTMNSLLRYDPSFQTQGESSVNPYGMLGGPGLQYEDLVWHPINRDFKANKGIMAFDAVKARFFKFEFTDLNPQPYTSTRPISRTVRTFTSEVMSNAVPRTTSYSNNTGGSGVTVNKDAATTIAYADSTRLSTDLSGNKYPTYTPTQALYAPNPSVAATISQQSNLLNFQTWQPTTWTPGFSQTGKHYYETVEVTNTNKVGYFAGLKGLAMYRVDYLTDDDTDQYLEVFHDNSHLDQAAAAASNGIVWDFAPGGLTTPPYLELDIAAMQSQIFRSLRRVRGIQFATTQSEAVQLLTDPDFVDQTLSRWVPYGDASITSSTDFTTDIGSTVQITRGVSENFWANLELRYASWDDIEADDPSPYKPVWDDLESQGNQSLPEGGIASNQGVTGSQSGRLYVAARVFTPKALTQPLFVQVVDAGGQVLAEQEVEAQPGQISEWFVGYTYGELPPDVVEFTWDQIETTYPTWTAMEAAGTWDQIDNVANTDVGAVYARLLQRGSSLDTWYVDNIAVFEDPIRWEFSNDAGASWWPAFDIRNDPNGVLIFPTSTSTNPDVGRSLMWRVKGFRPGLAVSSITIRPWYDSLTRGIPHSETIQPQGPNVTPQDQLNPVEQDPRFKAWHKPIPQSWWFAYRQWLAQGILREVEALPPTKPFYLSGAFVVPTTSTVYLTDSIVV
jgi:hypothetical protein